jgi:hypothetical protein
MPTARLRGKPAQFLKTLRETAEQRNRELMNRVNEYLDPVRIDYDSDVVSLTPSGNVTERHLCLAYARKANQIMGENMADFWSGKLATDALKLDLPEGPKLQNTIRAKTMKMGGAGYVKPDQGSFPRMADMNAFVLATGGIPTHTWLDGTSEGESAIERLLETAMRTGAAALNIIPDRNYTKGAGRKDPKCANLYRVVELASDLNLPVIVGTEMNSPGQKFADDFQSDELSPLAPVFVKGAYIVYGHCVLQRKVGLGYTGGWARRHLPQTKNRNEFYERVGRLLDPGNADFLKGMEEAMSPDDILRKIEEVRSAGI